MVVKTIVKAFTSDGIQVDEIEWLPHGDRRPLEEFLADHFILHPKGSIRCYNQRVPNPVILEEYEFKSLFS